MFLGISVAARLLYLCKRNKNRKDSSTWPWPASSSQGAVARGAAGEQQAGAGKTARSAQLAMRDQLLLA